MSFEALRNFLKALERNIYLRKEISKINNLDELINIGKKNGFIFNHKDIEEFQISENYLTWFKESEIPPIRKIK